MNDHRNPHAPRLDALLARLRRALLRQVWLHGLGTVACGAALWLLFAFLVDWRLHPPTAVRVMHGVVLVALPLFLLQRQLLRLLSHVPGRSGLAILVGRAHPQAEDLLVSAVELAPRAAGAPNRELIERVVADADSTAAALDPTLVLDPRKPRLRFAAGAGASLLTAAVLLLDPNLARIFFQRMLGADVAWPQRTTLTVEIPVLAGRAQVFEEPGGVLVRAARGTDVPVLIEALGVVPRAVELHFDSGHTTVLPASGTALFRTALRSVQQDVDFYVTGGDDRDRTPRIRVEVLQPPDVAGLAFDIRPPAYSGRPDRLVFGTDIEVLQGARIRVHVLPDPLEAEGIARLLPANREVQLTRAPFPSVDGGESTAVGHVFELVAESSLRFNFELTDETGLPNPDPGLFGVQVIEDRRPEVVLLAPGRADVDVVAGGAVPLRLRVEDDFGVADVRWDVRPFHDPEQLLVEGLLVTRSVASSDETAPPGARLVQVASARLEVDELGGETPLLEGQQVILQVVATDNRTPDANQSQSAPVRLQVVSGDEFLRRLKDKLARAGEMAGKLDQLAEDGQIATRDALATIDMEQPDEDASGELGGLINAARRVQGDARALARELAEVTEGLLYSRVDDRAGPLLEALDERLAAITDRSFHGEPWRELVDQYAANQLGQANLAGDLVELVGLALTLSDEHSAQVVAALVAGQEQTDAAHAHDALTQASLAQRRVRETLDLLLVKLGEWDNFQSVLTLTRDILKRQQNLNQRTRKYAEDH